MLARGVFSSWVTDDTKRDRISDTFTLLRTALCVTIRLTPQRITAKLVASNVVSTRRLAESKIGSRDALMRILHWVWRKSGGTSDAVSEESMKRRGNARCATGWSSLFDPSTVRLFSSRSTMSCVSPPLTLGQTSESMSAKYHFLTQSRLTVNPLTDSRCSRRESA